MMDRRAFSLYVVIAVLIIGFCRLIGGSNVSMPNTFVNGTVANAVEVNANFDALRVGTNDNFTRIQDLESQVLDLETRLSNIETIVDPDLVDRITALENASPMSSVETLFYIESCIARFSTTGCTLFEMVSGAGVFVLNETQPLNGVTLDVDGSLLFDVPRDGAVLLEVFVEGRLGNGEAVNVMLGSELICSSLQSFSVEVAPWRKVVALTAGTHRLTVDAQVSCNNNCGFPCGSHQMALNGFTALLID